MMCSQAELEIKRFEGNRCFHLQGRLFRFEDGGTCYFKTFVIFFTKIYLRRENTEELNLDVHLREGLKPQHIRRTDNFSYL